LRVAQPASLWRSSGLGSADTNAIVGDDDERASEVVEYVSDQKAAKYVERGVGSLVREAELHDAVVGSRLIAHRERARELWWDPIDVQPARPGSPVESPHYTSPRRTMG
jgi:hypothetical protein